jgi:N-acyl-D-amino-acid deacylase
MKRAILQSVLFAVSLLILPPGLTAQEAPFDILIRGGRIIDGTGNPWYFGDVGIRGDRIVAVGQLGDSPARRVIDATGKYVVPGFIDIHSHADEPADAETGLRAENAQRRAAPNLVMQGITTVAVNQDGRSPPVLADQRAELERLGIGLNTALMVGHNSVRAQVIGRDSRRPATPEEVEAMRRLVRQGMEEGAFGLSAGLEYTPGIWSTTDEVVALAEEVARYNGVYIAHTRSEGADPMWYWPSQYEGRPPTLLDAVQETIEIGERSGARVVVSHIKAKGSRYWGSSAAAIRLIAAARARGVPVYADQYPYNTTGSDGNTVLIPRWALRQARTEEARGEGEEERRDFREPLERVLGDDSLAALLNKDIAHEIERRGGAANVVVFEYPDAAAVGKNLAELAAARGLSPVEMAIHLQLEGFSDRPGGGQLRGFSLWEGDIEAYAAQPWTATATDGWITLPEDGFTHVRVYGTFPRKIAHYARERGILSVADAIRTATSLAAQILGLPDRGLVHSGYIADLVVFDLEELQDNATFFEPHQYPSGIEHVLVNGQFVAENGQPTWALPGRVITPPGREASGATR